MPRQSASERSRLLLRAAGTLFLLAVTAGLLPLVAVYFVANGPTVGALTFASLPLLLALVIARRPRWAAVGLTAPLLFVVWRVGVVPRAAEGWRYCDRTECGRGPWWSYLAPEREAVFAGLELSRLTGVVGAAEYRSFHSTFDAAFPPEQGLPNPLLIWSRPGNVQTLVHLPPGKTRAPCIVFLHGFGGMLSAYLRVIAASPLGAEYVVVAPILDPVGAWGSARGEAAIDDVLKSLPPEADPSRVFLIGLSNGSIYGARYAPRFKGAVLLSGIGETRGGRLLVVSGKDDVRIPIDSVRDEVARLRGESIEVELHELAGDHGMILSHSSEWTAIAAEWMRAR